MKDFSLEEEHGDSSGACEKVVHWCSFRGERPRGCPVENSPEIEGETRIVLRVLI